MSLQLQPIRVCFYNSGRVSVEGGDDVAGEVRGGGINELGERDEGICLFVCFLLFHKDINLLLCCVLCVCVCVRACVRACVHVGDVC